MADYRTNVSFMVEWTKEACDWFEQLVKRAEAIGNEEDVPNDDLTKAATQAGAEQGYIISLTCERENDTTIWITQDETFDVDNAAQLIRQTLEHFDLDDIVGFEWSHICSKPRLDAYGGGAIIITKDGVEFMNTGTWLYKRMAELTKEKEDGNRSDNNA